MTREEIIRMAWEAGGHASGFGFGDRWAMYTQDLERFAALVAAAEREACAKVCDQVEEKCWESWDSQADPQDQGSAIGAAHCAAAIRARGME